MVCTDASKNVKNNIGVSICIPAYNFASSLRLSDNHSVTCAEFFAIFRALNINSIFNPTNVLILSDSFNSLKNIYFGFSSQRTEILNDILCFVNNNDISFCFCYIPGHVSYYPHDITYVLTKRAYFLPSVTCSFNLKFHEIRYIIDKNNISEWTNNSHLCTTGIH